MDLQGCLMIGGWCVDPTSCRVTRDGVSERLEARTMRLLIALAQRSGDVVSVNELLDTVWEGVTVTPDSVYQAMAALRRALGDDPRNPKIIATVPRLGYRLVAGVQPLERLQSGRRPSRRAIAWSLGVTAAALLGLGGAVFALRVHRPVSVAALVLLDMSSTMDQDVLTEDLTERLAGRLAEIPGLRTPGFRAALALRGKRLRPVEAARLLNVDFVLDGAIHTEGAGFRLAMRLIRGDTGFVVWWRDYHITRASALTVQDTIANDVAKAVGVEPGRG